MVDLNQVFGISRGIPEFTYVDRSALDGRFTYLLGTERHIVIHGASKQGKSCLRRKILDESDCVIVQCKPEMRKKDIWNNAMSQLGVTIAQTESEDNISEITDTLGGEAQGGIPVAKGKFAAERKSTDRQERKIDKKFVGNEESDIELLASNINKKHKRLILEDFHYLNEEERKQIAFDLKAFYELNVFLIIIGIWSEQNLLTYYNGDLTGRIEEITINWTNDELKEVLEKGEICLNITFSPQLKNEIIQASFNNVGILQRLAEKICYESMIIKTNSKIITLNRDDHYDDALNGVIEDIGQRYKRIFEVFDRGFRSDTKLKMYYKVFKVLTTIEEKYLIDGIPFHTLLKEIQKISKDEEVRPSDLTQCLERIERLQSERRITPLLISYNKNIRSLILPDREFLFYRKYSHEDWEALTT